jgi:hypothetical protein
MPALAPRYFSDSDSSTDYRRPASRWEWRDEASGASDDTSELHHSRRSEDTENPHWSSRWGGWGFTNAHLEDDSEAFDKTIAQYECMQRAAALRPRPDTTGLVCAGR